MTRATADKMFLANSPKVLIDLLGDKDDNAPASRDRQRAVFISSGVLKPGGKGHLAHPPAPHHHHQPQNKYQRIDQGIATLNLSGRGFFRVELFCRLNARDIIDYSSIHLFKICELHPIYYANQENRHFNWPHL